MTKTSINKKILCLVLALIITVSFIPLGAFSVLADESRGILLSNASMYSAPGTGGSHSLRESHFVTTVAKGAVVSVLETEADADGDSWYKCRLQDGTVGYLFVGRVYVISSKYDADFEKNLQNFPESYRTYLRTLHTIYPNARFVADILDISFDEAVNTEYSSTYTYNKKFVELTYGGEEWRDERAKLADGSFANAEGSGRWTYASREAIAYFTDPRNYLNSDMVFALLQQSFDASETKETLKSMVSGTFLANGYGGNANAYIDDIFAAAKETGVSSYIIAATIITEQGVSGQSNMISGTYSGYNGYYNFFNVGASGSTTDQIYQSGLTYAKNKGWDTRYKSILGGANTLKNGYINAGQDTYYYMDYNVITKAWGHQYATSVYDAKIKGQRLKKGYSGFENTALTFKIPVFTSIPEKAAARPDEISSYFVNDSATHWHEYVASHKKVNEQSHIYDNDCDESCNVCEYVRTVQHNYVDGVCAVCGKENIISGTYTNAMSWEFNEHSHTLTVTGSGDIPSYSLGTSPWNDFASCVNTVKFNGIITNIGSYAFYGFTNLKNVYIIGKIDNINSITVSGGNDCFNAASKLYIGGTSINEFEYSAEKLTFLVRVLLCGADGFDCDINGDNIVDVLDLVAIKRQIADM